MSTQAVCRRKCLGGLLILAMLTAGGCSARRARAPVRYPAQSASPAEFGDATLYLRDVQFYGLSSKDRELERLQVRKALAKTIARTNAFRKIVNDGEPALPLDLPALVMDVEITVDHSAWRTYILDALAVYPFIVLFFGPFTPQWGTAEVTAKVIAFNHRGGIVWETEAHGEDDYSIIVYSWFRTRPVEEAYREAYAQAFQQIGKDLVKARGQIVASIGSKRRAPVATAPRGPMAPPPRSGPQEAKIKLAMLPTSVDKRTAEKVPALLDDYFLSAVQNAGNYTVIGQSDIAAILGFEAQKSLVGCDDASCIAEVGGALGVDYIISVQVAKVEEAWVVNAKLINIRDTVVEARVSEFIDGGSKALMEQAPAIINKLFTRLEAGRSW